MDRTIDIAWDGEQLKIKPTMELAHEIEQIVSVPTFILTLETNFKISDCCKILSSVLTFGGVKVTPDQVYEEIADASFAEIVPMMIEILQKTFPMFFQTRAKKKTTKKGRK